MIHKVESKEHFFKVLQENAEKEFVLHFNCTECGDEQVTYQDYVEDVIDDFVEKGEIYIGYDCTNCHTRIACLKAEEVEHIEIIE